MVRGFKLKGPFSIENYDISKALVGSMSCLVMECWPDLLCQAWIALCGAGFIFNQKMADFPHNSHATTSPRSTSCQTDQCYNLQCAQLQKIIDNFFPPIHTMNTNQQWVSLQLHSTLIPLCTITKVCDVFTNNPNDQKLVGIFI